MITLKSYYQAVTNKEGNIGIYELLKALQRPQILDIFQFTKKSNCTLLSKVVPKRKQSDS